MPLALMLVLLLPGATRATDKGFTTLDVGGEAVRIYRDDFGVPHIFAETRRGLFEAYGYAVGQDRLWQLEVNRRSARGRLAEIFGAGANSNNLNADRSARTRGYTDAELDQQFALLPPQDQEVFSAYVDGINRYVNEIVVPDPAAKLPFEFHSLNLGVPGPWTTRDAVAFAAFEARLFYESGDGERSAQTLLTSLITQQKGFDAGLAVFNDLQPVNVPDSPTTVPREGAFGKRQKDLPGPAAGQLEGAEETPAEEEDPRATWEELGVPTKIGSHGWVVSAARSTEGAAMLFGGPQVGFNAPEIGHEVQLKGDGLNVAGLAFAGIPAVLVGRTDHVAWTQMSAISNNVDTYVETTCAGGTGYMHGGACIPFETRVETILVKGAAPVVLKIERSVHGPVVDSAGGVKFTRKSVQWKRELESIGGLMAMNSAHDLDEFGAAIDRIVGASHFLYADRVGNIAYWRAGKMPVHPASFDIRLPLPGDGSAEWTGDLLPIPPIPSSVNPSQGWLANWNNRANNDEDIPGAGGKQARVLDIQDRLENGPISLADMRDIAKDISRTTPGAAGRNSRYFRPYLFGALDAVPSVHPLAAQARAVLEAWDGSLYADAVTSTTLAPGQVLFSAWLSALRNAIFKDDLGASLVASAPLLHALDDAFGVGSDEPLSRDYFNGKNPNVVMSAAFTQAVDSLRVNGVADPAAWSTTPRDVTRFRHRLFPTIPEVASIPESNKATYTQIVVLSNPAIVSENILTLGQSGFIQRAPSGDPVLDPHFKDQLERYREFRYKPMCLFRNVQLECPAPD